MQRMALTAQIRLASLVREARDEHRERGLTTTEIAVLTFVLVATAVAIGALLYSYAEGRVESLPEDTTPNGIPSGGG